jgi:predicted Zn-dependent peptidase
MTLLTDPVHDSGRGLVSVALAVAAGSDDDPEGLHGTAHLVEHLMFPRAEDDATGGVDGHAARIAGVGGVCNAETHRDHTVFHTTAPAAMLPEVLEWEARRLLSFDPAPAVLRTETAVIAEEIRGAPPTGRLWDTALAALYPGSRDSYGTPAELSAATAADVRGFFRRHYRAESMVLAVTGDIGHDEVSSLVRPLFAEVPGGGPAAGSRAGSGRPRPPGGGPAVVRTRPLPATVGAVAVGHPLPDPRADRSGYLAQVLLAEVLGRGRAARSLREDPRLTAARVTCGLHGQWLASAAPDLTLVLLGRAPGVSPDEAVAAWRGVLTGLAEGGVPREEHRRALHALLVACHRNADSLTARAVGRARTALLLPGSGGLSGLPDALRALTPDDVAGAARALLSGPHSLTELAGGPR